MRERTSGGIQLIGARPFLNVQRPNQTEDLEGVLFENFNLERDAG